MDPDLLGSDSTEAMTTCDKMLSSVKFAEDKVLTLLILREKC